MPLFQYISCYGLSSSRKTNCDSFLKFQYISCYGLSLVQASVNLYLQLFQYISCYGLSWDKSDNSEHFYDFNTSHVTVYQKLMPCGTGTDCHFNTSHVTVYLLRHFQNLSHLYKFQYISCYGLSMESLSLTIPSTKFQYISCYGLSNLKI